MRELREIRLRRGLSQADLSAMTGVAEFTISEIESGKRSPRPSTLRKLAAALETPVEALTKPPSGLEQFLAVHVQHLEQIRETVALLAEVAGTPGEWEGISAEEAERRVGYLQMVVGLLGESTRSATEAAREGLRIERGDDPKVADQDEPPAKRNPGEDRLAALLSTMEATGTG